MDFGGFIYFAPSGDWSDVEAENSTDVTSGTACSVRKETCSITVMGQQLQKLPGKKEKKSFEFHVWKPFLLANPNQSDAVERES